MSPSADGRPIFVEIADQIADDILVGLYAEETQVPSTTELSVHYRINPATAGKALNRLVDVVEQQLTDELDVVAVARTFGTTEHHLRRMFSSLAGMPLSEYIRRRRMTVAAADVLGEGDLLDVAVRFGYGSTEAFGRAFRAVHGVSPGDVLAAPFSHNHNSGSA